MDHFSDAFSTFDPYDSDIDLMKAVSFHVDDTLTRQIITSEFDHLPYLVKVTNMIRRLVHDGVDHFDSDKQAGQVFKEKGSVGNTLLDLVSLGQILPMEYYRYYSLNPYFQLYTLYFGDAMTRLRRIENLKWENPKLWKEERIRIMRESVAYVRKEAKSPWFKTHIKSVQRNLNKKRQGLIQYINQIFGDRKTYLVLRCDFMYEGSTACDQEKFMRRSNHPTHILDTLEPCLPDYVFSDSMGHYDDGKIQEVLDHRKDFIKRMRLNFKWALKGYIWRTDYSVDTGFRHHIVFIIDESMIESFFNYKEAFTKQWEVVTNKNKGLLMIYDRKNQKSYRSVFSGNQKLRSPGFQENLHKMIDYLTRPEFYRSLALPGKEDSFGRGYIKASSR